MFTSTEKSVLPVYQRHGSPRPTGLPRRGHFRLKEKYFIFVAIVVILCVCYSFIIFLPDGRDPGGTFIRKTLRNVWSVDPKALVVPPPRQPDHKADGDTGTGDSSGLSDSKRNKIRVHEEDPEADPHRQRDRERLQEKIDQEQIPLPVPESEQRKLEEQVGDRKDEAASNVRAPSTVKPAVAVSDGENEARREKVRQMMILAWDGYAKYAWGTNELRPLKKTGHSASIFGESLLGATIIDALGTLYIMGLLDRFETGRKWVEMSFNLKDVRGDLSVFEMNIRFVGGLLSCYALTKDEMFVHRAVEVADALLPAFDTPTGIPYALVNPRTQKIKNYGWASQGASILSEFGSLHFEFEYLSIITGNSVYKDKVVKVRNILDEIDKPGGLYPLYLNPKTKIWASRDVSLGALGDSFFEYLLKSWLVTNKRDEQAKRMFDSTMEAVYNSMVQRSKNELWYIAQWKGSYLDHKMEHLGCFWGGMFAMQSVHEANETLRNRSLELGKEIGRTCHESYIRSATHLGPEAFRFNDQLEAVANSDRDSYYILRPEVVETYFYLWRVTKDPQYREWAWDAVQALEKHCKTENGYSGLRNVYNAADPVQDDVQQSFFLAETLKYLYLIFSPDDVIPLNKWVFNTEAHPFPIRFDDTDHLIASFANSTHLKAMDSSSVNKKNTAAEVSAE